MRRVSNHYGASGSDGKVFNMLGEEADFSSITLAHIWPASYTNWNDVGLDLALPGDFHEDCRNFLLLPKDLHDEFDKGYVIFTLSRQVDGTFKVFIHTIHP
jgi:ABC-type phosphate transport system substrate-binding protein